MLSQHLVRHLLGRPGDSLQVLDADRARRQARQPAAAGCWWCGRRPPVSWRRAPWHWCRRGAMRRSTRHRRRSPCLGRRSASRASTAAASRRCRTNSARSSAAAASADPPGSDDRQRGDRGGQRRGHRVGVDPLRGLEHVFEDRPTGETLATSVERQCTSLESPTYQAKVGPGTPEDLSCPHCGKGHVDSGSPYRRRPLSLSRDRKLVSPREGSRSGVSSQRLSSPSVGTAAGGAAQCCVVLRCRLRDVEALQAKRSAQDDQACEVLCPRQPRDRALAAALAINVHSNLYGAGGCPADAGAVEPQRGTGTQPYLPARWRRTSAWQ